MPIDAFVTGYVTKNSDGTPAVKSHTFEAKGDRAASTIVDVRMSSKARFDKGQKKEMQFLTARFRRGKAQEVALALEAHQLIFVRGELTERKGSDDRLYKEIDDADFVVFPARNSTADSGPNDRGTNAPPADDEPF